MKKICENKDCGKEFETRDSRRRFCSMSCSAHCNNKGVRRRGVEPGNCLNCNNKLSSSVKKYCSNKCQQDFEWKTRRSKIEKCGEFESCADNEASRKIVKKYLIEKHGRRCCICGLTEWMGKEIPLVVDHIDGNAENRRIDNFRLVCGNCDMQLPTYKSKNKNGRAWRRKRYKEGKSY